MGTFSKVSVVLLGLLAVGLSVTLPARTQTRTETPSGLPAPIEIVRSAVANEVTAASTNTVRHMFRARKQTPHGSQTRLYVETREAMAGMTIAYDDRPLSPEQLQGEEVRLEQFLNNPEQLERKRSREKEDAERTMRIVKALPDAFVFEYDGTENSSPGVGRKTDPLVRLKFRPNPHYAPPTRVEQVLTGMAGVVLIDAASRRIARIEGTLFKDVGFGWGILGHLDKGGTFLVEQADVGDGSWDITHMSLRFTGKILWVKSLNISSDEAFNDFRRVPSDLSFAKAVEMLKAEVAKLAQNRGAEIVGAKRTSH